MSIKFQQWLTNDKHIFLYELAITRQASLLPPSSYLVPSDAPVIITISDAAIDRLPQVDTNNDLDLPPSLPETIQAVQQISSGKAPGSDAIPPEVYRHGGPRLMAELTTLFQKMWCQRKKEEGNAEEEEKKKKKEEEEEEEGEEGEEEEAEVAVKLLVVLSTFSVSTSSQPILKMYSNLKNFHLPPFITQN
ncbi:unnamed protein product [Schistocephalus solidus]|uniref:Uncharacterized protein n=1 Tax=Schistocephalus solidus TaxID=70667 RepID=A0A183SGF9_SCHSO|nr:unnamed protein product [Schistocephalus solidus]